MPRLVSVTRFTPVEILRKVETLRGTRMAESETVIRKVRYKMAKGNFLVKTTKRTVPTVAGALVSGL